MILSFSTSLYLYPLSRTPPPPPPPPPPPHTHTHTFDSARFLLQPHAKLQTLNALKRECHGPFRTIESSGGEKLDADEPVDVHSWGDKETHIRVTNPEGFAVKVRWVGRKRERERRDEMNDSFDALVKTKLTLPLCFPSLPLSPPPL